MNRELRNPEDVKEIDRDQMVKDHEGKLAQLDQVIADKTAAGEPEVAAMIQQGRDKLEADGPFNTNEAKDAERVAGTRALIDGVSSAFEKVPAQTEDVHAWRGGQLPDGLKPGDRFTDKSFISTTSDRAVADKFAGEHQKVMRIEMPAGTKALPVDLVLDHTGGGVKEREWLLNKGTTFEVVSNGGTPVIKVVNE